MYDPYILRADLHRRLRNAIRFLSENDKNWMIWLEKEVDTNAPFREMLQLIESRARAICLKQYHYYGRSPGNLIFLDWPFLDNGSLSPG